MHRGASTFITTYLERFLITTPSQIGSARQALIKECILSVDCTSQSKWDNQTDSGALVIKIIRPLHYNAVVSYTILCFFMLTIQINSTGILAIKVSEWGGGGVDIDNPHAVPTLRIMLKHSKTDQLELKCLSAVHALCPVMGVYYQPGPFLKFSLWQSRFSL